MIMNIMLVAVAERTARRSACAAPSERASGTCAASSCSRRRCCRWRAAWSASSLGGLIALAVDRLAHFPANLTPGIAALGLGLSVVVGLAAGYWPAVHASKLQPVDALRAE